MMYQKITSWFLAIAIFMFGVLKFVNPFKGWYSVQVANSGLGDFSYAMGMGGEITVGTTLIICLFYREHFSFKLYNILTAISFFAIIVMMLIAVYVHLHPHVPAEVLPLKIKPPYIPLFFLLIALSNMVSSVRNIFKPKRQNK